jgi:hypothetical protein
MMISALFDWVKLVGEWAAQVVTVSLPRATVEQLIAHEPYLGPELELLHQHLTPAGTHPVMFTFGTHYRARMTWPSMALPPLTYDELAVLVPFVGPRRRWPGGGHLIPRTFMPRLFLNQFLPTLGGWLYWGFNKTLARISYADGDTLYPHRYDVRSLAAGAPLATLRWRVDPEQAYHPALQMPEFHAMLEIYEQALSGQIPGTVGPILGYSPWRKFWSMGWVRPILAELQILAPFVNGLDVGRYTCEQLGPRNVLGAYQLHVPWALSLPRWEQWVSYVPDYGARDVRLSKTAFTST